MNNASLDFFGIAPHRSSGISTEASVKLNNDVVQQVFELAKLLGLENTCVLCLSNMLQCRSQQTKGKLSAAADDLVDLLRNKGLQAELDKDGMHIHVQCKKVNIGWLYQLSQEDLKQTHSILTALETNKQTILNAFKPGRDRSEQISVFHSRNDALHIVAQEGHLYIEGRSFEPITLLTRDELLVLFKDNLNGLKLTGYTFRYLDLRGANLKETDFSQSKLIDVDLTDAVQDGMAIKDTTFKRVTGFELRPTTQHSNHSNGTRFIQTAIHVDAKRYFLKDALLTKSKPELRLLLIYLTNLSAPQRAEFKQHYPNVYIQLLEQGADWTLYSDTLKPVHGEFDGIGMEVKSNENWRLHDDVVKLLHEEYKNQMHALPIRLRNKIVRACQVCFVDMWFTVDASYDEQGTLKEIKDAICSSISDEIRDKDLTSITLPQRLSRAIVLYILIKKDVAASTRFSYDLRISSYDLDTARDSLIESLPDQSKNAFALYVKQNGFGNLLAESVVALNKEGIAITIDTVDHMTWFQHSDASRDLHNIICTKLSLNDQRSLSVTNQCNDRMYKDFWEKRIIPRPFSQMQIDYLANKVLGPVSMARIEQQELSIAEAQEARKNVKAVVLESSKPGFSSDDFLMYVSDEFLAADEIFNPNLPLKDTLADPNIQFLINSGRLTKEQLPKLTPYHWEHLRKPYILNWLKNDKLSVDAFLQFTEEFLGFLSEYTFIQECITNDQLSAESFSKLPLSVRKQLKITYLKDALIKGVLALPEAIEISHYSDDVNGMMREYVTQGYSPNAALLLMSLRANELFQKSAQL